MGDTFVWKLKCPVCPATGEADIREPNQDAWSEGHRTMRVRRLSDGFIETGSDENGATFACAAHPDVPAKIAS